MHVIRAGLSLRESKQRWNPQVRPAGSFFGGRDRLKDTVTQCCKFTTRIK